jgi:RNA polymerase sigma-70 factor (ECF subfamily)
MVYAENDARLKSDFTAFIAPHREALFAGALQFTGNRANAEDLLQETYMRAFVGFKRSQDIEKPRAWLFTIMRNAYINYYHKNRAQPARVSYEEGLDHKIEETMAHGGGDPQKEFFSRFLDQEIESALESLPQQFREAVILCDISGLSYEEIGQILDCPLGTVRSRICRGREILFHKLYNYAAERNLIPNAVQA